MPNIPTATPERYGKPQSRNPAQEGDGYRRRAVRTEGDQQALPSPPSALPSPPGRNDSAPASTAMA